MPIPKQRWKDITIDFIVGLPLAHGKNTILTIIDRITKEGHFVAYKAGEGRISAKVTADLILEYIFRLYSFPESVISDRGA